MAKDNDKGLYLPLKIDLSEWEKSLAQADADLQKAMRQLRSQVSDIKLKYDVEIANAKTAGDSLKAVELEAQKLTAVYNTQKEAVEALNRAYQQSVKEKGENAQASKALAQQLVRESKALERTQQQISSRAMAQQQEQARQQAEMQRRILQQQQEQAREQARQQAEQARIQAKAQTDAQKQALLEKQNKDNIISGSLMMVSPQLEGARRTYLGIADSIKDIGGTASLATKALGGFGLAIAAATAGYKGLKAVSDNFREVAEEAAQASDKAYLLAEKLNITYKEAEQLNAIFTLDGTNAEGLVNAQQKLNKQLRQASEDGNLASQTLKEYGVNLWNTDQTQKSMIEQLKEMAKGYQRAKEAGAGLDFLTAAYGPAGNQFAHILNGLDDYIAKTEQLVKAQQVEYELNHELLTVNGQLTLQQQELTKATGGNFGDSALEAKRQELEYLKERTRLANDPANREMYRQFQEDLKTINSMIITAQGEVALWIDKVKAAGAELVIAGSKTKNFIGAVMAGFATGGITGAVQKGIQEFRQGLEEARKTRESMDYGEMDELAEMETQDKEEQAKKARKAIETRQQKQEAERKAKEAEAQAKKEQDIRERFNKELRDAQADEYQREINALNDKRQAYIDEGISEVEANRLFAEQKAQIDKKYFDKLSSERQKQVKQAEEASRKEVEEAKKVREAQMSDAQRTLQTNLKLARYIQRQQKEGKYNEADAQRYAEQLHYRQNGYRHEDIDWLKGFTVDKLKEIADARTRLFKDFAQQPINIRDSFGFKSDAVELKQMETPQPQQPQPPVTPQVQLTVNFDNTVVEDISTMDKLANKVAEVITPAIETALKGGAQYGY